MSLTNHQSLSDHIDLYFGDSLLIMPILDHYDFIFTDPPYNVGKKYTNHNDSMPHKDFMRWTAKWIRLAQSISSSMAICPPKIHLREFWNLLPKHHQIVVGWSMAGIPRGKFIHQYSSILVPTDPKKFIADHWFNVPLPGQGFYYHEVRFDHPAQTSLALTKKIIQAFTDPGDIVLDPFGGSGTTAIACIELGRKCTLIDNSKYYHDISIARIKTALMQPSLLPSHGSSAMRPS